VLDNDIDPDGDALSASLLSNTSHGALQLSADGSFSYVHDGSEITLDGFEYVVTDGVGGVAGPIAVSIEITPVNDPPEFVSAPILEAVQGEPYSYGISTTDVDGPATTLSAETLPAWLTIVDAGDGTGTLSGTPSNSDVGDHLVVLIASDGVDVAEQQFTIVVGNRNDPPVFLSEPVTSVVQSELYAYAVVVQDPDGDSITLTAPTLSSWMSFDDGGDGTGLLSGTPSPSDVGIHSVILEASDGSETITQEFTVTVDDVNDAPAFTTSPVTTAKVGVVYTYAIEAVDPDGDALTFIAEAPAWLALTDRGDNTAVLTGTPAPQDVGEQSVIITAFDAADSTRQEFAIAVRPADEPPVAVNDSYQIREGGVVSATAGGAPGGVLDNDSDPDGDVLQAEIVTLPEHGVLDLSENGSFVYQHDGSETTEDRFTYIASDGTNVSDAATVVIGIRPVNDAPVAVADAFDVEEDVSGAVLNLLVNDFDAEGDAIRLVGIGSADNGDVIVIDDSTVAYTGPGNFSGLALFKYVIEDQRGARSDSALVTISVAPVNDPPIAGPDFATTGESAPITVQVLVNDYDPEGDALQVSSVSDPARGTAQVDASGRLVTYTPDPGFVGEEQFEYEVSDGNGGKATGTVTITVTALQFVVEELDSTGGSNGDLETSRAFGINDGGLIVGTALEPGGEPIAVAWTGGQMNALDGQGRPGQAMAIGNGDVAVGVVANGAVIDAVVWEPGQPTRELLGLGGGFTVAFDVNDRNEVVGTSLSPEGVLRPMYWTATDAIPLDVAGASGGEVFAISDMSDVAGAAAAGTGMEQAMRGPVAGPEVVGSAGLASRAYGINNLRMAAGSRGSGALVEAVLWTQAGEEVSLPAGGSPFAEAYGVNDAGWIVGTYLSTESVATSVSGESSVQSPTPLAVDLRLDGAGKTVVSAPGLSGARFSLTAGKAGADGLRAALWVGGVLQDLNALVPAGSGWTLVEARDVNNAGQIIGYGLYNGAPRGFSLVLTGNAPPTAVEDDAATFVGEEVIIDLLANDLDADGDTLTVLRISSPSHGVAELIGPGTVRYVPDAAYEGRDVFSYTMTDGKGGTDRAEVRLTIADVPEEFALHQNYPNPFNPSTTISYSLPEAAFVTLSVFDALGREVASLVRGPKEKGTHEVRFEPGDLSNGIYLYRLQVGEFTAVRKLVFLK
jgi:VCBS repeat-containing protein